MTLHHSIQRGRPNVAARAQRGISLVTTLLFMTAALSLGIAVMSVNVMQERMIGNTKDRDLALQAAEAALRDAELDISTGINATTAFANNCAAGLCTPPSQRVTPSSLPVEAQPGFDWTNDAMVRKYGQYTGVANFPSVTAQPRYVIEKFGYLGTPAGESLVLGAEPGAPGVGYRITARGVGARPETVVILQSIYAMR